jgi:HTH-type transcriptional regulator/antitoxin HigA
MDVLMAIEMKVLKTRDEYETALRQLHTLLDSNPVPDTKGGNAVELLALLISTYERDQFERLEAPSAIEAIRFRMEQLELVQKDLVRFIGAPSRVSEVLSGKRALTITMIRALSEGLHIPASVLLNEPEKETDEDVEWEGFPLKEMVTRGWLSSFADGTAVREYVSPVLSFAGAYRRTLHFRGSRNVDHAAMIAWIARVWRRSADLSLAPYEPVTTRTMKEVVGLSWSGQGPILACEYLAQVGVAVIIEPALPRTFVDGATIFAHERPIIGLTLRHDRLDNFWYTLLHELAHIAAHSGTSHKLFVDDIDAGATDRFESEADVLAGETLIPQEAWKRSPASRLRSRQAVEHLARQLKISPAIVAGRIRREFNDYTVLNEFVGQNSVRQFFTEVNWPGPDS